MMTPMFSLIDAAVIVAMAFGVMHLASPLVQRLGKKPPRKEWRVSVIDPDGCPTGPSYQLDIGQVGRLVTHLRRETGQASP